MPRRPPKKWFYEAVEALRRKPDITDPEAVAAWQWYHGLDRQQKQTILKEEESMAGLPAKYAKMGFKRGWKAYRAKHSLRGIEGFEGDPGRRGKKRGKAVKVRHFLLGAGDFSQPAIVSRPIKRASAITPGRILSPVIDLALIIVGMALGAQVKKWSPIKNPHLMNGTEAVLGIGGSLFVRNRFVKMPLLGVALQSSIAEAKLLMPNLVPIAGDDETVYLPVGEDDEPVPQLEYSGDPERIAEVVVDGEDRFTGEDERVGSVIDGEDDEGSGEGGND